ncbi:hypothetical protein [Roseovarius sp. MMSF_3281]|uniref:hypothetical protein n=1 Tax=Roseovarius sp. MMSF_3281 TaxID=3046694 RepID=UPI00273D3D91|nr:hypothetical protein [Roseovarius sp. MMSF_3281]
MTRALAIFLLPLFLAACGGGSNPFEPDTTAENDGETEDVDAEEPTTENSLFAFNLEQSLTLNDVEYDAENDELVINNLPFDGPEGRYDRVGTIGQGNVYRSRRTATTGQIDHYAVFVSSENMQGAAALGDWSDLGYGGANVKRDSFALPPINNEDDGEYVYLGTYAGLRKKDDRTGIELVQGDSRLLLDVLDLDPDGNIQGSIVGTVSNRSRRTVDGTPLADLPDIVLKRVSFNNQTGTFTGGEAVTLDPSGDSEVDSGFFEGFIGGPDGGEMAANIVIEGPGEQQEVFFEEITWTHTETVEVPVGDTGLTVEEERTTSGSISGLNSDNRESIENLVDQGRPVPQLAADRSGIPDGAEIESEIDSVVITSDNRAREIGVTVNDVVETP